MKLLKHKSKTNIVPKTNIRQTVTQIKKPLRAAATPGCLLDALCAAG